MQPRDFSEFARRFGGSIDPDSVFAEPGLAWLGQILKGLSQLVSHYHGDRNKRGEPYRVNHGFFDRMEINGAADRSEKSLVFGVSLGAVLRLMHIHRLLVKPETARDHEAVLSYLMAAHPDEDEPENAAATLSSPLPPDCLPLWQDRTFFSIGFVFMHEAFHTLIGHADYMRGRFAFGLDELELNRETGETRHLIQAMELEADGAAFSNFWLTLRQSPKFGICGQTNPDPADRIAEATLAGMMALLALEARRVRLKPRRETTHPFPSRRIVSVLRLLATFERRGGLPAGCLDRLAHKAAAIRPALETMPMVALFDLLTKDRTFNEEDRERLSDLIALYKKELTVFDDLSYAPRIRLPAQD